MARNLVSGCLSSFTLLWGDQPNIYLSSAFQLKDKECLKEECNVLEVKLHVTLLASEAHEAGDLGYEI